MPTPNSPHPSKMASSECNFFIFGTDSYLVEEARNKLFESIRGQESGDVPVFKLDLEESSVEELLATARILPMFAQRQVVLVNSVMRLRDKQAGKLADYFQDPCPFTALVFLAGELDRDDRKKKIFGILREGARVMEVKALNDKEAKARIASQIKQAGFAITLPALDFLIESYGGDFGRLSQEIEKVILLAGQERKITLEMVVASAGASREHSAFEFLDAIAAKEKLTALRLASEIMTDSFEALQVMFLLVRLLRQLLQIKELSGEASPEQIARQVGMYGTPQFVVEKRLNQAKRFSVEALSLGIQRLGMLDDRIKSSSIDTKIFMELLIHDLTT